MEKTTGLLIFFGIFVFFYLILFLIYHLSGWRSLAREFPDSAENSQRGDVYSFQSVIFSFISGFKNSITITVKRNGLEMKPIFPFSLTCPLVFIPWDDVKEVNRNKGVMGSGTQIVLAHQRFTIQGRSTKVIRKP